MSIVRKARTDLASEERSLHPGAGADIPGVAVSEALRDGFHVTTVDVQDEQGEKELCKPIGRYITVELDALLKRQEDSFEKAATLLADILRELIGGNDGCSMVVGLGNEAITPDAVGPLAADHVMATRHLKQQMPEDFAAFSQVVALRTGVLGMTGIESAELVKAVCAAVSPARMIAIDALASASLDKLCRTVQLSNSGIVPGSGVGNDRAELSQGSLGMPVIAVGVPTVVDAANFTDDPSAKGMFVTPRDIDATVKDVSKLIGYAVNLALHKGLTIGDVDMFLS